MRIKHRKLRSNHAVYLVFSALLSLLLPEGTESFCLGRTPPVGRIQGSPTAVPSATTAPRAIGTTTMRWPLSPQHHMTALSATPVVSMLSCPRLPSALLSPQGTAPCRRLSFGRSDPGLRNSNRWNRGQRQLQGNQTTPRNADRTARLQHRRIALSTTTHTPFAVTSQSQRACLNNGLFSDGNNRHCNGGGTGRGDRGRYPTRLRASASTGASAALRDSSAAQISEPAQAQSPVSPCSSQDTIFALATGNTGPAGVAVIRISGPRSLKVLEALTCTPSVTSEPHSEATGPALPVPRRAVVRRLYDPVVGDLLDEALVLWMPGPRSFTGEDTVELHTHGSRAVINGVLDALGGMKTSGVRLAERGEFTQRAYGNGRMDLTGVEGLADLIAADTAAQRKQALKQMGGALRDMYEAWRTQLKGCLAHAEAVIDFGDDEEDVGGDAAFAAMMPRVFSLAAEIDNHLRDGGRGEIVRSGVRVAIVGPPNAGKSSLLNLLAARPAAIVSPVAGTTRDVVEIQMDIAGLPVTLSDTAGLREATDDEIEKEGIRRARSAVDDAHLAIFVVDGTNAAGAGELLNQMKMEAADAARSTDERDGTSSGEASNGSGGALDHLIVVVNKLDLAVPLSTTTNDNIDNGASGRDPQDALDNLATAAGAAGPDFTGVDGGEGEANALGREEHTKTGRLWKLSCKTKEGLDGFMGRLEAEVSARFQGATDDESPLITRRRHRQHVEACLLALRAAQEPRLPLDLAAEELRIASSELGRITGAVGVEELLDVIFRDFCIGK